MRSASFSFSPWALAAAVLACSFLLGAGHAAAQTDDERARARAEFERGVAAFGNSEFQAALDAFQEAYRLAPHPSVRLNIANCYQQMARPVEALVHFEHYLTEATSIPAAQRREIEATIRGLRGRVGTLTFQVTPDGAEIVIDGSATRRAPVSEPVRVVAGDHEVVISLDGFVRETQTVRVDGGGDTRVAVRLRRAEVVAVVETAETVEATETSTETVTETSPEVGAEESEVTTPEAHDEGGGIRLTAPFFIAGGVTVAAAIGWGVTGGIALSENDAFEADVVRANDPTLSDTVRADARTSGMGHADSARTLAIVSDVFLVTTLVGLGATTFFFILAQTEEDATDDTAALSPTLVVVPLVAPAGSNGGALVGLSAAGTF
jgi:hypothetical protein